ncbi:winged helix-turn-helix domain-containing protein, partial [Vibrio vulnificus]|nr:winged helix-turn-helix domain-containing protein [Vibrio vulnificus]HDU8768332.1 winged helix-turn-helix domain-containing protein [Vibrio vulnificus]
MNNYLSLAKERNSCIQISNLIYDPQAQELRCNNKVIELDPRSLELLELLLSHVSEPISNNRITEEVWNNRFISRNVVTNRIGALRVLLKEYLQDIEPSKLIATYPKKGYYIPKPYVSLVSRELISQLSTTE